MPSLSVQYSLPANDTSVSLSLEEAPPPIAAISNTEAAQLANAVAGRDPCGANAPGTDAPDQEEIPESKEETIARAMEILDRTMSRLRNAIWCDDLPQASTAYQTKIIVTTDPVGLDYTLHGLDCTIASGKIEPVSVSKSLAINGLNAIASPSVNPTSFKFTGRVFDMDGREISPPNIIIQGGRLFWGVKVVGSINVAYNVSKTTHLVTCTEDPCMVLAYYADGAESLTLDKSVDDDADLPCLSMGGVEINDPCYLLTTYEHHCACGGGRRMDLDYETSDEIQCDGGNKTKTVQVYVDCSSEDKDDSFFDMDHFEDVCCFRGDIPSCKERTSIFTGEPPPTDQYPAGTVFVPVNQPSGPCGIHTEIWEEKQRDCCEGVLLLSYDWDESDETITSGGGAVVLVSGGMKPFTFQLFGTGFHFSNGATKIVTDTPHAYIIADSGACGSVEVTVKDNCSQRVAGAVRNISEGEWVKRWYHRGSYDDYISALEACSTTVTKGQYKLKRSDWEMRSHCGNSSYQAPCSPPLRSACAATYASLMWHPAHKPSWGVDVGPCTLSNTCVNTSYETQFCRYDMWLRESQYDGWRWEC